METKEKSVKDPAVLAPGEMTNKRSLFFRMMVSPAERRMIEEKAKQAAMKPTDWCRSAATTAQVTRRLTDEEIDMLWALAPMDHHLEQIARVAEKEGLFSVERRCREIITEIDKTIKYLNSDDRKNNKIKAF
jgi:hypothetical protein